jgi:DNA-binding transcriptional LysR family regulator
LLAGLGIGLLPDFSLHQHHAPTLFASRNALPPEGAALARGGPSPRALSKSQLVRVLPDWQVQGFFGERIYALRPWSAQVPKAVQCLVAHLRASFARGFGDGCAAS